MATVFYDHLIPWHKVERFLIEVQPTPEEKWELLEIIEETVHTEVLTIVLSHIPESSHEEFLKRFHSAPHASEHLVYIQSQCSDDVEASIATTMEQFIDELVESLKSVEEK